MFIREGVR